MTGLFAAGANHRLGGGPPGPGKEPRQKSRLVWRAPCPFLSASSRTHPSSGPLGSKTCHLCATFVRRPSQIRGDVAPILQQRDAWMTPKSISLASIASQLGLSSIHRDLENFSTCPFHLPCLFMLCTWTRCHGHPPGTPCS